MKIAIVTSTYNRAQLLYRLFRTLVQQSNNDFIWIIIDDGSNDNTEYLVNSWLVGDIPFEIRYYKKENAGKSKALNYAFENNKDIDFFAIIDSDEQTLNNSVDIIRQKAKKYLNDLDVGAIFFRYKNMNGSLLHLKRGKSCKDELILSRYQHDALYSKDDGCIGYYKRTITLYRFPEYPFETYIGPTVLQMSMADQYKIAFTHEVVGIAEYQENGISRSGRRLRLKNPIGMMCYCLLLQSEKNKVYLSRIKYAIAAQAYYYIAKKTKRNIPSELKEKLNMIQKFPGMLLGYYWMKRYGEQ